MKKSEIQALIKNPETVLKKMSENDIANIIQLANFHYYNSDKPLFSDNIFDIIKDFLEEKNPYHPILKHVGAVIENDDRKAVLPYYMGSMDKIKSDGNVIQKWKKSYAGDVIVSDKLDGNSGLFYWCKGEVFLYTRGNGKEGQNISHLIPFIRNIPEMSVFKDVKEFTVRGELIISKSDFDSVKNLGANARNMVAGLLNAKIPNLEIAKLIQFIAYELIIPHHEPSKQFSLMDRMGFKVAFTSQLQIETIDINKLSNILMNRRMESEFEIDGVIVAHDAIHNRIIGENPKHAFAFKSIAMMDRAEVIVKGIEWNISKDGFMKPVILFDPVQLSGASVRRATGFNAKFIRDNHIGAGARLVVMRSGDVIPHIVEVVEKATPSFPDMNYTWNETGVDIVVNLSNAKDELGLKHLVFFFSKLKVDGLSEGNLAKFQKAGLDSVGKIVKASRNDLLKVEGFKEKMADKILGNISERFKEVHPITLMEGSNTFGRGIGEKKLKMIEKQFPEITTNKKFAPNVEDLVTIDGIEKKTAESIIKGLPKYWEFASSNDLMKFHTKNVAVKENEPMISKIFEGKGFLFTGVRSKQTEDFIKERGGDIKSSMSKKVDFLICKDPSASTSKVREAKELGIKIISLEEFMKHHELN